MNYMNLALVKLLQFVTFVLFTFMVLVYFGTLLLIPLDLLMLLIKIFSLLGLPGAISVALSIPVVGYVVYLASKIPSLLETVLKIGLDLVIHGHAQIKRFDAIVAAVH